VYPLGGGGIGRFVTAAARLLSRVAEVTILTTSVFEETYERLRAARDPGLPGDDVRIDELTSFEDWHLYRELARAGHFGVVIPERLLRYRVRADSMQAQIAQPRRARLEAEIEALMRENAVRWTSLSA